MNAFHRLAIKHIQAETGDAVSLALDIPAHLQSVFCFKPGQHIVIRTQLNGEDIRRSYSICSGLNDNELRVAIKRVPGGRFSTFANTALTAGQMLDVLPPGGHFQLQPDPKHSRHYLAVAVGSGITPILSMIKSTLETEAASHFTLLYGNRSAASTLFREALEDLKNRFMQRLNLVWIFSREPQDVELFNGRIDTCKCEQFFTRWLDITDLAAAYLCGPQSMVRAVRDSLLYHGMHAGQVHSELFGLDGPPPRPLSASTAEAGQPITCQVTVIRDGRSLSFEQPDASQSLLEAANAQGAELPYACKAGVCSTCKCKVVEGDVEMENNQALEADEVASGYVLSCQSYARSPRVILDFDQR